MVYDDEVDRWVVGPVEDNLSDILEDYRQHSDYDDYDDYQDTARDCIGWEEDIIKNGEYF